MKLPNPGPLSKQSGLSLIELMIAILLSSLLLLGVLQMFGNISSSDKANTALSRLQESGRVALDMLKQDLRRSGYQGCASPTRGSRANSSRIFPRDAIGEQNTASIEGAGTASDTLAMFYGQPAPTKVTSITASSITFVTRNSTLEGNNRELVLTNCEDVAIFQGDISARSANPDPATQLKMPDRYTVTNLAGANGGAVPDLSGFGTGAQLLNLAQSIYDVRNDPANNNRPTLYKGGAPMIADVENFQVLYGINQGGQINWINAGGLNNALRSRVNQLQISLVIASPDNAASGTSGQAFNIANIGANMQLAPANDQRLRRVFNTIIDVRNR